MKFQKLDRPERNQQNIFSYSSAHLNLFEIEFRPLVFRNFQKAFLMITGCTGCEEINKKG